MTNDIERLPWFYKRYAEALPRVELPARAAHDDGAGGRGARGHGGRRAAPSSTCRSSRGCCTWRPAWCGRPSGRTAPGSSAPRARRAGASRSSSTSPCRRGGAPGGRALVRPAGPRARAGRAAAARRRARRRRHRRALAHRLALPRARLPAHLLGRGHDARPAARGGRLGRARRRRSTPASPTGRSPRSSAPTACTSGRWRSSRSARSRRSRRPARPPRARWTRRRVEFPLATAAQRAGDDDALGEPWERGAPVEVAAQRSRSGRAGRALAQLAAADGPGRGLSESVAAQLRSTVALRGVDVPHFVAVHAVDGLEPGVYRWPDSPRRSAPASCGASSTASPRPGPRRATPRSS